MEDREISDRVIQHVLTMSDKNLGEQTVTKLARFLGMDRYKLSREFKRQKGITVEYFLYREKMTRAAFLLMIRRNISIREVAKKLGFCTYDYFSRKFKQYYGVVPGKFKEFKTRNRE